MSMDTNYVLLLEAGCQHNISLGECDGIQVKERKAIDLSI